MRSASTTAHLASLGVDTEWCLQQVVHLLGHLYIQAWVCTHKYNVLLGFALGCLQLGLAGLVLVWKLHRIGSCARDITLQPKSLCLSRQASDTFTAC